MFLAKNYKNIISVISIAIVACLLYSNVVFAVPDLNSSPRAYSKETLAPQSEFIKGIVSKLDADTAGLLMGILKAGALQEEQIDLDTLWGWIQEANIQKECILVRKDDKKIVVLARGLNIEFSVSASVNSYRLPNSNIFVNLNYYPDLKEIIKYAGLDPTLDEERKKYVLGNLSLLADSLKKNNQRKQP